MLNLLRTHSRFITIIIGLLAWLLFAVAGTTTRVDVP